MSQLIHIAALQQGAQLGGRRGLERPQPNRRHGNAENGARERLRQALDFVRGRGEFHRQIDSGERQGADGEDADAARLDEAGQRGGRATPEGAFAMSER